MKNEHSPLQSKAQGSVEKKRAEYFESGIGTTIDKMRSLMRFMSRQETAKVLAYQRIFEMTRGVAGSIADCGVFFGQGLMTYANLAAALEPYNYQCKIIGFDTFAGDQSHDDVDLKYGTFSRNEYKYVADSYDDLRHAIEIYDSDRPLGHLPRVELVKGDLVETAPAYIAQHPESLFRIIHLSINLYKPTRATIEAFLPRTPAGGAIVVHGLNYTVGATKALLEVFEEQTGCIPRLEVIDFCPNVTFCIKE